MTNALERMVDEIVYDALMQTNPGLVDSVRDLINKGQTPEQIEKATRAKTGGSRMAPYVRAVAEHLRRGKK